MLDLSGGAGKVFDGGGGVEGRPSPFCKLRNPWEHMWRRVLFCAGIKVVMKGGGPCNNFGGWILFVGRVPGRAAPRGCSQRGGRWGATCDNTRQVATRHCLGAGGVGVVKIVPQKISTGHLGGGGGHMQGGG